MHVAQQRRRKEETLRRQRSGWLPAGCTLGHALINQPLNTLQLHTRHDGANVDHLI